MPTNKLNFAKKIKNIIYYLLVRSYNLQEVLILVC